MALTSAQKQQILTANPRCYVCAALDVPDADFAGYAGSSIQFDHWRPRSLVGDTQEELLANQRPIHAAPGGADPLSEEWAASTSRNCHQGKSNTYTGEEWCDYIRIFRQALHSRYSDDLMPGRDVSDKNFSVEINWDEPAKRVTFRDQSYPLMVQQVGGAAWLSFSTLVPPTLLWRDEAVQSRSASPSRLAKFAWHLRSEPLLAPILCRWSDGRLKVFDGNHRLCAFILARKDHPVPVTIFQGPDPEKFLNVAAEAHDTFTQLKYQYTDKALKFSALNQKELELAQQKYGDQASEVLAWHGLKQSQAMVRILGRISSRLDEAGGWRVKWMDAGLTDASWNQFLQTYAKTTPEMAAFSSNRYLREDEFKNLCKLCDAFDDELFDRLPSSASASLKTKWWKRAHVVFARALSQAIKHSLNLDNTPEKAAYTQEWSEYAVAQMRKAVINWYESPAWTQATTANNEPEIDLALQQRGFTESALFT